MLLSERGTGRVSVTPSAPSQFESPAAAQADEHPLRCLLHVAAAAVPVPPPWEMQKLRKKCQFLCWDVHKHLVPILSVK